MPVAEEVNFAYHLASNEPNVRRRTLSKLIKWIRTKSAHVKTAFTEEAMMKLWKGLFFCMWMTDKPLVQQEVADNICSLIHNFRSDEQTFMFIDAFFKTMAHEWFAIDRFRLDKFMMLVRRFFRQSLVFTHKGGWKDKRIKSFNACLTKTVFDPSSEDTPAGLKTHITDIFLQELARVHGHELTAEQGVLFLEPFFNILVKTPLMVLRHSVRDNIFHLMMDLDPATAGQVVDDESTEAATDEEEVEEVGKTSKQKDDSDSEEEYTAEGRLLEKSETCVDLPAIPFDYEMIANRFVECSKLKNMRGPNRCMIANLVKKFWELSKGVNPRLNIDEDSGSDLEITESDIAKAAKRLKEEEEKELLMEKKELKRLAEATARATKGGKFGLDTCSGIYEHLTVPDSSESGSDADTESADEEIETVLPKKKLKQSAKQRSTGKQSRKDKVESGDLDGEPVPAGSEESLGEETKEKRKRKRKPRAANKEENNETFYDGLLQQENQRLSDTSLLEGGEEDKREGEATKKSKKRKKRAKASSGSENSLTSPKKMKKKVKSTAGDGESTQVILANESSPGVKVAKKRRKNKPGSMSAVRSREDKTNSTENSVANRVTVTQNVTEADNACSESSKSINKRVCVDTQNSSKSKKMKEQRAQHETAQLEAVPGCTSEDTVKAEHNGVQTQSEKRVKKRRKSLLDINSCDNSLVLFKEIQEMEHINPEGNSARSPLTESHKPTAIIFPSSRSPSKSNCVSSPTQTPSSLARKDLGNGNEPSKGAGTLGQALKPAQENAQAAVKFTPKKELNKFAQFASATPMAKFLKQSHFLAQTERPKQKHKAVLKRQRLSDSSSYGKKVNFLLSRNQAQDPKEYLESLKASPQIPFDASKKPTQGVLKVREQQGTPLKSTPLCKRKRASEFF